VWKIGGEPVSESRLKELNKRDSDPKKNKYRKKINK
jgi:hypothetical protein